MEGWDQDHESSHYDNPGFVTVSLSNEVTGDRRIDQAQCVVDRILDRRARRPDVEIGVLASTNAELAEVFLLCKEHGLAASMEGRSSLLDALCVQQILALFRLADFSGDSFAHYLITRGTFLHAIRAVLPGLPIDLPEQLSTQERSTVRRSIASAVRTLLVNRGPDGFIIDLREAILKNAIELSAVEPSRLRHLVQMARTF